MEETRTKEARGKEDGGRDNPEDISSRSKPEEADGPANFLPLKSILKYQTFFVREKDHTYFRQCISNFDHLSKIGPIGQMGFICAFSFCCFLFCSQNGFCPNSQLTCQKE
jgi:hypothetical protein